MIILTVFCDGLKLIWSFSLNNGCKDPELWGLTGVSLLKVNLSFNFYIRFKVFGAGVILWKKFWAEEFEKGDWYNEWS